MSNIRLFYSKSLSLNLTDKLDKSQSHYVAKVMRIKENEVFSLFNNSGEWEAKILNITKSIVEFNVTKQLRQKENTKELWLAFSPIESNYFNLPAKRPNFSLLNCEQTYDLLKYPPPHWRETINTLLDSLSKDFIKNL